MWEYKHTDELYHYGVLGMKWGRRRYQNKDGTLTTEGRKKYSSMNPDKLNKTLKKEVHRERRKNGKYTGMSNQWRWDNTIGKNSENETNKFYKQIDKVNSDYNKKYKKLSKNYSEEKRKTLDSEYIQTMKDIGAAKVAGERYSKSAIDKIGQMNISYLQDLGYNKESSEYIQKILNKSKRVSIY